MYIVHTWTSPNSLFRRFIYSRALSEGLHARLRAVIGQDVVGLAPVFGNTTEYDSFSVEPIIWIYRIWHWNSTRKIAKRVLSQLKSWNGAFSFQWKPLSYGGEGSLGKVKASISQFNHKMLKMDNKKATVIMKYRSYNARQCLWDSMVREKGVVATCYAAKNSGWLLREAAKNWITLRSVLVWNMHSFECSHSRTRQADGARKGNIWEASEEPKKKETLSLDGWDVNDSTRPVAGCSLPPVVAANLPSILETWIKFTPSLPFVRTTVLETEFM